MPVEHRRSRFASFGDAALVVASKLGSKEAYKVRPSSSTHTLQPVGPREDPQRLFFYYQCTKQTRCLSPVADLASRLPGNRCGDREVDQPRRRAPQGEARPNHYAFRGLCLLAGHQVPFGQHNSQDKGSAGLADGPQGDHRPPQDLSRDQVPGGEEEGRALVKVPPCFA